MQGRRRSLHKGRVETHRTVLQDKNKETKNELDRHNNKFS